MRPEIECLGRVAYIRLTDGFPVPEHQRSVDFSFTEHPSVMYRHQVETFHSLVALTILTVTFVMVCLKLAGFAGRIHSLIGGLDISLSELEVMTLSELGSAVTLSSKPLLLAATSTDGLYQLTERMNSIVQQQLSGTLSFVLPHENS